MGEWKTKTILNDASSWTIKLFTSCCQSVINVLFHQHFYNRKQIATKIISSFLWFLEILLMPRINYYTD